MIKSLATAITDGQYTPQGMQDKALCALGEKAP